MMTANEFLDLVRRSQLVEEDQLTKFLGGLAARNGRKLPETAEKLSAEMIAANLLTEWQAEKLLAGKHKGFMLGKYKLLRHLGKGGMSQVYLAEHTLMKRKVAIKVLPPNRVEDSTYLERFRIEARAAAKLDDPNIVRAYDIDQRRQARTTSSWSTSRARTCTMLVRDKGPLPYEKAADYVAQVARGLAHAHEMGLVHRDIKPANCLLDKHEVVKLLDMGLARLIDDEASLTLDNNENVLGTADYLAPEQALNSHKADARADIYSLGCTLYFLLTGHPPFPDGTISERLHQASGRAGAEHLQGSARRAVGAGEHLQSDDGQAGRGAVPDGGRGGRAAGRVAGRSRPRGGRQRQEVGHGRRLGRHRQRRVSAVRRVDAEDRPAIRSAAGQGQRRPQGRGAGAAATPPSRKRTSAWRRSKKRPSARRPS